MNLDEAQRAKVAEWIANGEKLSDIQSRLASELGVRLTYMEVRLLVDDLKLTPKDAEPAPVPRGSPLAGPGAAMPGGTPAGAQRQTPGPGNPPASPSTANAPAPGGVSVTVDQLARPGAIVSGKVTFSDGMKAEWQVDQTGRLALMAQQTGYRPSQGDLQQFQTALDTELSKMGF